MRMQALLLSVGFISAVALAKPITVPHVQIPAGRFSPLFGLDKLQDSFEVASFEMDASPVTYAQFARFLVSKPEWWKKNVFKLYVDSNYLRNWKSPTRYQGLSNAPVTYVSWYAATAYCEEQHGRLPSTLEWEYVAAASETEKDASLKPEYNQKILEWYTKPKKSPSSTPVSTTVPKAKPNFYGLHDLHGLIWEWTGDFNTFFVASDNRSDGDKSKDLFCGGGAIGAKDRENYAAFMRYAFRSSLQARYSTERLGFRCAYDGGIKK